MRGVIAACVAIVLLVWVVTLALCRMSKDADDEAERLFRQLRYRQERERLP